jgi:hypothetical protein
MTLHIARGLDLPDEAVTQTFAILAKRGVGKTYTASVLTEEMLKNNMQVIVVDPIGVWWGLRTSADGKKEGLQILIAGGEHGDIPLQADSGEIIANLVIDNKLSAVVDLSLFRKGEQARFMADFAETIYRRNRTAMHMIIDEADAFAPQRVQPGEARMLGAMEDLVRRGRARGIGMTMITQRPAVLNKNVLTQIEVLVALRMTSPLDQKAIDEWIRTHADEQQRQIFMEALPSLPIGTAWFWSPGWLDGMFKQVHIRKRETLDSSSTPKVGQKKVEAHKMADVDLDKIRKQMELSISAADENDPKKLRARIKELEAKQPDKIVTQVEVLPYEMLKELHTAAKSIETEAHAIIKIVTGISSAAPNGDIFRDPRMRALQKRVKEGTISDSAAAFAAAILPAHTGIDLGKSGSDKSIETFKIGLGERKILIAIGQYPKGITRQHLTVVTGYKQSSRNTYLQRLMQSGLAEPNNGRILITERGKTALGPEYAPLPTGRALREYLLRTLPAGEALIFKALIENGPMTREEISAATEYKPSSRNTYLQRMSSREIIDTSTQQIKLTESLF